MTQEAPRRVFWTWTIHHSCNYRCPYCFITTGHKDVFLQNAYPGREKLLEVWDRIHRLYGGGIIKFAGGEPFTYPDFMELLGHLGRRHFLDLSSNMFWDVREFTRLVPRGGARVEPSYHPGFYPDIAEFAEKCRALADHGAMGSVHMVGYPPLLGRLAEARDYFAGRGLDSVVLPFRGAYRDRPYPESYTEEEKRLLKDAGGRAPETAGPARDEDKSRHIREVNQRYYDWYVEGRDRLPGAAARLCLHGCAYAKIQPDGEVLRCCASLPSERRGELRVGNIFDPDFRLFAEPRPCAVSPCPCWKPMLAGQESQWGPLWKFETYPAPRP